MLDGRFCKYWLFHANAGCSDCEVWRSFSKFGVARGQRINLSPHANRRHTQNAAHTAVAKGASPPDCCSSRNALAQQFKRHEAHSGCLDTDNHLRVEPLESFPITAADGLFGSFDAVQVAITTYHDLSITDCGSSTKGFCTFCGLVGCQ